MNPPGLQLFQTAAPLGLAAFLALVVTHRHLTSGTPAPPGTTGDQDGPQSGTARFTQPGHDPALRLVPLLVLLLFASLEVDCVRALVTGQASTGQTRRVSAYLLALLATPVLVAVHETTHGLARDLRAAGPVSRAVFGLLTCGCLLLLAALLVTTETALAIGHP